MKAYYIIIEKMYVKAITIDKNGFGFMPTWEKEKAGIFELSKCEAFRNALLEKAPELIIKFEEFVKEER